jgi:hypothetical protein
MPTHKSFGLDDRNRLQDRRCGKLLLAEPQHGKIGAEFAKVLQLEPQHVGIPAGTIEGLGAIILRSVLGGLHHRYCRI